MATGLLLSLVGQVSRSAWGSATLLFVGVTLGAGLCCLAAGLRCVAVVMSIVDSGRSETFDDVGLSEVDDAALMPDCVKVLGTYEDSSSRTQQEPGAVGCARSARRVTSWILSWAGWSGSRSRSILLRSSLAL